MRKVTKRGLGYEKNLGERPFSKSIEQAALRLYQTGDGKYRCRLHTIAEKLVRMAEDGDIAAIRTVKDSLDGRTPMVSIDNSRHIHIGNAIGELMARRKAISAPTLAGESTKAIPGPLKQLEDSSDDD